MRNMYAVLACLLLIARTTVRADDANDFELRDGDRVVFIGNTFIERDQVYGYLETMLTARWPDRNVTFRNLGWSGDTVWGEARARFGSPADGFKHLMEHVEAIKPTVIFVGYGMNESFEGEPGLPRFRDGFTTLLERLEKVGRRIVVFAPIPHAALGPPFPSVGEHNRNLGLYTSAMREISEQRGHRFIDLFNKLVPYAEKPSMHRISDDGISLSRYGYRWLWVFVRAELGMRLGGPVRPISQSDRVGLETFLSSTVENFVETPRGYRFDMTHPWLPDPRPPDDEAAKSYGGSFVTIRGLPAGSYGLRIDGSLLHDDPIEVRPKIQTVILPLAHSPEVQQVDELRRMIVEKNRLYFHRWRPQNETYLFGFRKHEQGQNAAEVPKFDPLVEELEAKIAKLRVPVEHTYELIRRDENRDD